MHGTLSGRVVAGGVSAMLLTGMGTIGCTRPVVVEGDPIIRVLRKDAIPSIDRPRMIPVDEAAGLMHDDLLQRTHSTLYVDALQTEPNFSRKLFSLARLTQGS